MSYEIQERWPTATQDLLADAEKLEATHAPEQVNQPLFALIKARRALTAAKLALAKAATLWSDAKVRDRLISIAAALDAEHERFPLYVTNKRRTWRDRVDWAKPLVPPEVMTTAARKRATKLERPVSDAEASQMLHTAAQEMLRKG